MYFEVRIPGLLTTQQASGNRGFSVAAGWPADGHRSLVVVPPLWVGAPQVTAAPLQGREMGMTGSPTHRGETEAQWAPHPALSHAVGRR